MYRCWECSLDFYSAEPLQEHYESLHANAIHGWKSFGISEVSLFDTTDDEAPAHPVFAEKQVVKQYYRCCGCPLEFESEAELQHHSKTEHAPNAIKPTEDKPFQCEICYHTYTTKKGITEHQNTKNILHHQCATCGLLYGVKHILLTHEISQHKQLTYKCDICRKEFSLLKYLTKLKETMHGDPERKKKYNCTVCGASHGFKQLPQTAHAATYERKPVRLQAVWRSV
uniref:C2H2-type domain-containing protein n=1 Tax=Anopheles maculatus TaxID=74869 RepID=A0A182T755_9DIPT